MEKTFAILEVGSTNTKTHIYAGEKLIYENTTTIKFKKHYNEENKIKEEDLNCLISLIKKAYEYTQNVNVYGCSIFRSLSNQELDEVNNLLYKNFKINIQVVSQEDEALYTALGCYGDINYNGKICVFIGGGGSTELIFINNKKVTSNKYFIFGVVKVTSNFPSLKEDVADCTFDEVYDYVNLLIGDIEENADILILAGGDHLFWYESAKFKMLENNLYKSINQPYIIDQQMNDEYDRLAITKPLNQIRNSTNNPAWFDDVRSMKVITNLISHKINAKFIIPTKIGMEQGIKNKLLN